MLKGFFRKADLVLLAFLIVVGAAASYYLSFASSLGDTVVVKLNGKEYGTYSLSQNQEITIENGKNKNIIIISDGTVYMKEASCKNQVCVDHAPISTTGQSIVCLPNRIMVTLEGKGGDDLDAISN